MLGYRAIRSAGRDAAVAGLEAQFLINVSRFAASQRRIEGDTTAPREPLGAYFRPTSAGSPGIGDVTADRPN